MKTQPVVFVAFLEQDNLGVGYVASMLVNHQIDVKIIDFRLEKEHILEHLKRWDPAVVGFSIIFQYHIYEFRDLIAYLRENGIHCHFSAGGHYPSLRYAELLEIIPDLDSVVLFEGEYTFLELAQAVLTGQEWKHLQGIAYRDGLVVTNALRPLEEDLDRFPPPVRQPLKEYALGKKYATLLAGRGCYYHCSFCSIREFYSKPPGAVKRIRRPEMVVREMELLHEQSGCSVFMFQDDDFPVTGSKGRAWTTRFCDLLAQKGLSSLLMWKINCRPDEIDAELFAQMLDVGLFLVYLGLEDGTDSGLQLMNKRLAVETSLAAVNNLKRIGIEYDFGFMLFHPETTTQSILNNLEFLYEICGDGSSPVTFCKMLPYAETQIEQRLKREGRLKGKPGFEDYDFNDASLDSLYVFMTQCFADWIGSHEGVLNVARWARYTLAVCRRYYPLSPSLKTVEQALRGCIAQSNAYFIDTTHELIRLFGNDRPVSSHELAALKDDIQNHHRQYQSELNHLIDQIQRPFETLAPDVETLRL